MIALSLMLFFLALPVWAQEPEPQPLTLTITIPGAQQAMVLDALARRANCRPVESGGCAIFDATGRMIQQWPTKQALVAHLLTLWIKENVAASEAEDAGRKHAEERQKAVSRDLQVTVEGR